MFDATNQSPYSLAPGTTDDRGGRASARLRRPAGWRRPSKSPASGRPLPSSSEQARSSICSASVDFFHSTARSRQRICMATSRYIATPTPIQPSGETANAAAIDSTSSSVRSGARATSAGGGGAGGACSSNSSAAVSTSAERSATRLRRSGAMQSGSSSRRCTRALRTAASGADTPARRRRYNTWRPKMLTLSVPSCDKVSR